MEDHAKLLADLTATVSSMNAKLDDIHRAVFDLHTWKPVIERSVVSPRAEVGDLRARVIDITKPSSSTSPRGELPPLLPHAADAPPPAFPCKDNDIDTDAVYVAEEPLLADDASLPIPEQVETPRTPAVSSSFVLMFEPPTPARCSTEGLTCEATESTTAINPVLELDTTMPSKCSAECLVSSIVDTTQLDDVVSHETDEVVALDMANIIFIDLEITSSHLGRHRRFLPSALMV